MNERLFGFDTSKLKLTAPKTEALEAEIQATFGAYGYQSSRDFSLSIDN